MLGQIFKLAKARVSGASTIDQMKELLATVGVDADFQELSEGQRPVAFQSVARCAADPAAGVVLISGKSEDGSELMALLVMREKNNIVQGGKPVVVQGVGCLQHPVSQIAESRDKRVQPTPCKKSITSADYDEPVLHRLTVWVVGFYTCNSLNHRFFWFHRTGGRCGMSDNLHIGYSVTLKRMKKCGYVNL